MGGRDSTDGIVVVLQLLPGGLGVLVDLAPVNTTGLNLIEELQQHVSVTQIDVEVVDEGVDSQRVHPVPEGLLLSGLLNDLGHILNGFKGRPGIEQVGDEGQVQLLVSAHNILLKMD